MAVRLLDLQLLYGVAGAREMFERLCAQLVRSENPNATGIRVHLGDGGVDSYVGDWANSGQVHVFQVKFFPNSVGRAQRQQVRDSLAQARSNPRFTLTEWTLCLPLDLSQEETSWFTAWQQDVSSTKIKLNLWDQTALLKILFQIENRGLKEEFFRQDHLTQIREMHSLLHRPVDDFILRVGSPDTVAARKQLLAFLQSNRDLGERIIRVLQLGQRPLMRFDITTWPGIASTVLAAFPDLSAKIIAVQQSLDLGNRFLEAVDETIRQPRYPTGFWNRDGISCAEIESAPRQFTIQAMNQAILHLSGYVLPQVEAIINQLLAETGAE